ncbi:MAG: enoyl-CoA hydratase/isomerase family protein [Gammaproteobacteria bacterium]
MSDVLETREDAGVLTLTLSRAALGNALDDTLVEALLAAILAAGDNEALHTLVLRGAGKHFCTGFDLSDLAAQSDGDLLRRFVRVELLLAALWHAPLRTVALAQGRAFGAGADLFACCDQRVAQVGASFTFPGARFGLVLGTRRLAARLGESRALACVTGGEVLDARAALATGLASDLVDGDLDAWLAALPAPVTERATSAALKAATRPDMRDADLAALVRSAARPGLKARIVAYREAQTRRG